MATRFNTRAKNTAKAGWRTVDAAIPWLILFFLLLLPLAIVFNRIVALSAGITMLGLLVRLAKRAR